MNDKTEEVHTFEKELNTRLKNNISLPTTSTSHKCVWVLCRTCSILVRMHSANEWQNAMCAKLTF